MGTIKIVSISS